MSNLSTNYVKKSDNLNYSVHGQDENDSNIGIELIQNQDRNIISQFSTQQYLDKQFDHELQNSMILNRNNQNNERNLGTKAINKYKSFEYQIIYNVLGLIFILLNQLYISQSCSYESDHQCYKQYFLKRIYIWIVQSICISAIYTYWVLKVFQFNKHSLIYALFLILSYLLYQIYYIFGNEINSKVYIGIFNKIQQILCIFFISIGQTILFYNKYKNKNKKLVILIFLLLTLGTISIVVFMFPSQCDYMNSGINGPIHKYNNYENAETFQIYKPISAEYCSIIQSQCWYYSLDIFQDMSKIFPQYNCKNQYQSEKILQLFTKGDIEKNFIGFPAQLQQSSSRKDDSYQLNALSKSRYYNSLKEAKDDGNEVILDKTNFKYNIEVLKNQTLSQERIKLDQMKQNKSLVDNILIINIPGLSRIQMHEKIPKTVQWFKQYSGNDDKSKLQNIKLINNNSKDSNENLSIENFSLEFMRYHSFSYSKDAQSLNFFYGQSTFPKHQEKLDSIFDFYKKEGYITGYSNTFCKESSFNKFEHYERFLSSITKDHDSSSTFACDPNFEDPDSSFQFLKGSQSFFPRCLYGEQIQGYAFNYTQSFFEQYNSNKKFFMLEFSEGNEVTGQLVRQIDDQLKQFLEQNDKILNNTMIIFVSIQKDKEKKNIYSKLKLESEQIQERLPTLLIRYPSTINAEHQKNIITNSQKLVTLRNLHFTLKHIAKGIDFNQQIESLFIPQQDYSQCPDVGVPKYECSCIYENLY